MKKHISFARYERDVIRQMRNGINHAEDAIDLGNKFSYTMKSLFDRILRQQGVSFKVDDIVFVPGTSEHYSVNPKLLNNPYFRHIWKDSDLQSFVEKCARMTNHHYQHLNKHPEKTERKIRN